MATIPPLPEEIVLGIVQGMTYSLTVTWTDGASPTPNPLPMTGRYAHMSIRPKRNGTGLPIVDSYSHHITKGVDDSAPEDSRLATASAADISQEPGGQTGVLVVRLPATATAALSKVSTLDKPAYTFDLYTVSVADPTDAVQLATGLVVVRNSTTRTLLVEPS